MSNVGDRRSGLARDGDAPVTTADGPENRSPPALAAGLERMTPPLECERNVVTDIPTRRSAMKGDRAQGPKSARFNGGAETLVLANYGATSEDRLIASARPVAEIAS